MEVVTTTYHATYLTQPASLNSNLLRQAYEKLRPPTSVDCGGIYLVVAEHQHRSEGNIHAATPPYPPLLLFEVWRVRDALDTWVLGKLLTNETNGGVCSSNREWITRIGDIKYKKHI